MFLSWCSANIRLGCTWGRWGVGDARVRSSTQEAAYLATIVLLPFSWCVKNTIQHFNCIKALKCIWILISFYLQNVNDESPLYYTRTRGLFRECFLGEDQKPEPFGKGQLVELYISPVETWCRNVDYYIPDENDVTKSFNQEQMTRIREWNNNWRRITIK